MDWLIWTGAALTVLGICGLFWCVVMGLRARSAGLDDKALRARLQVLVAWNLGSLAVAALGLMTVIVGLFLG